MHAEKYDVVDPRVQFGVDVGIFNLSIVCWYEFCKYGI